MNPDAQHFAGFAFAALMAEWATYMTIGMQGEDSGDFVDSLCTTVSRICSVCAGAFLLRWIA